MLESFSALGSFVHTPCGPRKSGMPDSVEMPAPVSTTTDRAARTQPAISSSPTESGSAMGGVAGDGVGLVGRHRHRPAGIALGGMVDGVDQLAEPGPVGAGETEADPGEVDVIVVGDLGRRRLGCLDPAGGGDVGEGLV